ERELRRAIGPTRIGQQQGREQVAGPRDPFTAAAAAAGALGHRSDPQRAALAMARQRQRFRVGRSDGFVGDMPNPGTRRSRVDIHQNKDLAAAAAASTSGPGNTKNRRLARPMTPSTAFNSPRIGSKAGAGSTKYMTLTMAR